MCGCEDEPGRPRAGSCGPLHVSPEWPGLSRRGWQDVPEWFWWAEGASRRQSSSRFSSGRKQPRGSHPRSGAGSILRPESGLVLNRRGQGCVWGAVSWQEQKARVLSACLSVGDWVCSAGPGRKSHIEQSGRRGVTVAFQQPPPPPSPGAVWLTFGPFVS